jgi:hypothetical protein
MTLARGRPSYAKIGSKRLFQETLHHPGSVNRMRATSNVRGAGDHALGYAAAGPARIFLACCGSDNLLAKNQNLRLAAHIYWNSLSFLRSMTSRAHSGVRRLPCSGIS